MGGILNLSVYYTANTFVSMRKGLPIGIQNFAKLRRNNFIYVDKTKYIHALMTKGGYYFLSRPRRFGKSLLVSTLEAMFRREKALFKGLWIEDRISWETYPVLLLDFSVIMQLDHSLEHAINRKLDSIAMEMGFTLESQSPGGKLNALIRLLAKEQQVVILVDEYDKPIVQYLDKPEKADANREILINFYSVIKGNDERIRFFFLTGVSKFTQVSIFSDLNNLEDITTHPSYASMLGYTEAELETSFESHIQELAQTQQAEYGSVRAQIKTWYDGYSWDGKQFLYNPYSILLLFSNLRFKDFWFQTGTPTFLLKLLKTNHYSIFDLKQRTISERAFNKFDVRNLEINSLLFQTGYLTIKEWQDQAGLVVLDFPNQEVENAFSFYMLAEFSERKQEETDSILIQIGKALNEGDVDQWMELMQTLFANLTYHQVERKESYFHSIFYLTIKLLGHNIESEILTSDGRIDAVIQTSNFIYLIEFKMGDAQKALDQIKAKHYHLKYQSSGKKIYLLGIGFNFEKKSIDAYKIEIIYSR